mmetsp:Transcript_81643/g.257511  ORF Transcript_81643/g.257511 Transcript_81643/m.257511 type:complete len:161 (+) Transcript_81643:92-574(+)
MGGKSSLPLLASAGLPRPLRVLVAGAFLLRCHGGPAGRGDVMCSSRGGMLLQVNTQTSLEALSPGSVIKTLTVGASGPKPLFTSLAQALAARESGTDWSGLWLPIGISTAVLLFVVCMICLCLANPKRNEVPGFSQTLVPAGSFGGPRLGERQQRSACLC